MYREKDCMKKFCESLKDHAKRIIGFEKKKCYQEQQLKSHEDAKVCCICGKYFKKKLF